VATHKTNQLDINLSQVKDAGAREALNSIVRFVNDMNRSVRTNKEVKAAKLSNQTRSAFLDFDGLISGRMLELEKGWKFKVRIQEGELGPTDGETVQMPAGHVICGVIGWTQVDAGDEWNPMVIAATDAAGVYMSVAASSTADTVRFVNVDAAVTNSYRAVIFYKKGR
jgi:hypothetical protein